MKKFILKPIVFGTLASAIIVGCSSDPKDEVSPKPSCIYSIEGGDSVDIPFGTSYTNPSVNVSQNGVKIIDVKNDGTVDTSKLGIYKVSYSSESCANNKTRTIEVVPSSCAYKLAGASPLEVVLNGTYVELGVEVKDINNKIVEYEIDGNVNVEKEGDYTLTYKGIGCKNSQKREVKVKAETTACNYELKGSNPLVVILNGDYTDPGINVKTVKEDKTVENIIISGDVVNPMVAKDYEVLYQGEGCSTKKIRTVSVKVPIECTYSLTNDDKPYTLIVGNDYNEPGFSITALGKTITTGIAVDTIEKNKVGQYKVTYQDMSCNNSATRIVNVVAEDCKYDFAGGNNSLTLIKGSVYANLKPTVKNADGTEISTADVTEKSNNVKTSIIGVYEVIYEAKGCPNTGINKVEIVPLVCIYTPNDGLPTVIKGQSYTDPGVTVVPEVTVTTTGSIDTNVLGKQSIKYQGADCENFTERFVDVVKPDRPDPQTVLPNI